MINDIDRGRALHEGAVEEIRKGGTPPRFTEEELRCVIRFLNSHFDQFDCEEEREREYVSLANMLSDEQRHQIADELERAADEADVERGGRTQELRHSIRALQYYRDKNWGRDS